MHQILGIAANLRDEQELAEVVALLADVHVLTVEERADRQRQTWLEMVQRSVEDIAKYSDRARSLGASEAEIAEASTRPASPLA